MKPPRGGRCSVCGEQLRTKRITYTQELDGQLYGFSGVPADVCRACGQQYLAPDTNQADFIVGKPEARFYPGQPFFLIPAGVI